MNNIICKYCKTTLNYKDQIWVDDTDGDCCWGDDELKNENNPHIPLFNV